MNTQLLKLPQRWRIRASWMTGAAIFALAGSAAFGDEATASLTLSWDPNPEPDLSGYVVHYGSTSGSYTEALNVGAVTTAQVSALTVGRVYYFAVGAYNAEGVEGPPSDEVSYAVPMPPPPSPVKLITQSLDPSGGGLGEGEVSTAFGTALGALLRLEDGSWEFKVQAPSSSAVTIYGSADLGSWSVLGQAANPTGILLVRDFESIGMPRRFYRVEPAP